MNNVGANLKVYGLKKNKLEIDPLALVTPSGSTEISTTIYQSTPTAPSIAKSDTKSQLEIANELKEAIHYEFFMDVNGEITFKLPFYNMDVRENIASMIHDVDIINWNFIQSESEVITRVDVTGSLCSVTNYNEIIFAIWRTSCSTFYAMVTHKRTM
jgi:hypothetical protein